MASDAHPIGGRRRGRAGSGHRGPRPSVERLESRRLLVTPVNIIEYPATTPSSDPIEITTGPDGNLWFTEHQANNVATIDPTTHAIAEYPIPTPGAGPYYITTGSDGNLWFAEYQANKIGMINPTTHAISEFPVPTQGSLPLTITPGPDGNLWFTEQAGNNIGMINPKTRVIAEFPLPTPGANLQVITPGPDGNLWFAEFGANQIGRINPTTHAIAEFPVLAGGSGPSGITAGPDGNLWFTSVNSNSIGTINPSTLAFTNDPLPIPGAFLANIVTGSDGKLAFTEFSGNRIGQIDPTSRAIVETRIPTAGSGPNGITAGPDGNLWFAERNANQIGQFLIASPLSASGVPGITATENVTFTSPVATFIDRDPSSLAANFSAAIDWGDGSPSTVGTITQPSPGGAFRVAGSHAYAFGPSRTIRVTITDLRTLNSPVPTRATATVPATILDAPLTASPETLTEAQGVPFNATVATFSDADPLARPGNFSATIDWGDGTSTMATVLPSAIGAGFVVDGNHAYASAGGFTIRVAILDFGGSRASASSSAVVSAASGLSFVVTNTNDSGPGSLRQAILNADQVGGQTISFAIPSSFANPSTGLFTIAPTSALPAITAPTLVDGLTQGVFLGQFSGLPRVQVDGQLAPSGSEGLVFGPGSAGSMLQGLSIYGFDAAQVELDSDGAIVSDCYLGIPVYSTGSAARASGGRDSDGLLVRGGRATIEGNKLSGNSRDGLEFSGASASHAVVTGNAVLDNLIDGIVIGNGSGSETIGPYNQVSGNGLDGVELLSTAGNLVIGNNIGNVRDAEGFLQGDGNGGSGIVLDLGSSGNTIGGLTSPQSAFVLSNFLSSNGQSGVAIREGSNGNVLLGNTIGKRSVLQDPTNQPAPGGNRVDGVLIVSSTGNIIGPGNVISANIGNGIDLIGASGNAIEGDFIGTDSSGMTALGNGGSGVVADASSTGNTIGGPAAGATNVISGNKIVGVAIQGGSSGNDVRANLIGTNLAGDSAIGNGIAGVLILDSPSNVIGPGNLISGNGVIMPGAGIWIDGPGSTRNQVIGNRIGTDLSGESKLPNTLIGVLVDEAPDNGIGGNAPGLANQISGNSLIGVMLAGLGSSGNVVRGNVIGADASGSKELGNGSISQGDGLYVENAPGNVIGGFTPADGNLISGNGFDGVEVFGAGATGNQLDNNRIGTDGSGAGPLGNGQDGIVVDRALTTQIVANVISANGRNGVFLSASSNALVRDNLIGRGLGGQPLGNGQFGILIGNGSKGTLVVGNTTANNPLGPIRETDVAPAASPKAKKPTGKVQPKSRSFGPRALTSHQARGQSKARPHA